jgi:hypothetical protein
VAEARRRERMSDTSDPVIILLRKLKKQRVVMILYAKLKWKQEDWHGLADAAMDLRDIDAEIKGLEAR